MKKYIILIFAVLCGVAASQFPEYAQQYRQRLGGAVTELRLIVERFDADADKAGLTRAQALASYNGTGSDFLSARGQSMDAVITRYQYLSAHAAELEAADPLMRLWVFAKARDPQLAKATLDIYEPAVPVTAVGAAHAGGGFAIGWLLLSLLLSPFGRRRRRKAADLQA